MRLLVTGGTGTLGRAVVLALAEAGWGVRVLSRRSADPGPRAAVGRRLARPGELLTERGVQWAQGDLESGEGLAAAVDGVRLVVNCATTHGTSDLTATRRLVGAMGDRGGPPVLHVSLVGADEVPLGYYRVKWQTERIVEQSGLPWTVLRATQFHDLVARWTTAQRLLPWVLAPSGVRFQPIDVWDVARRLVELADQPGLGRAADIGGPEVLEARTAAEQTLHACRSGSRVVAVRVPGRVFGAYRAGGNLASERCEGTRTFEAYLAARFGRDIVGQQSEA